MKKVVTDENNEPLVYHKDHMNDDEKTAKSYTYTEDWSKVTAPRHLALRKKQLGNVDDSETVTDSNPPAESLQ